MDSFHLSGTLTCSSFAYLFFSVLIQCLFVSFEILRWWLSFQSFKTKCIFYTVSLCRFQIFPIHFDIWHYFFWQWIIRLSMRYIYRIINSFYFFLAIPKNSALKCIVSWLLNLCRSIHQQLENEHEISKKITMKFLKNHKANESKLFQMICLPVPTIQLHTSRNRSHFVNVNGICTDTVHFFKSSNHWWMTFYFWYDRFLGQMSL